MFRSLLWLAILCTTGIFCRAADFEYGSRPPSGILDVPGVLGQQELESISRPLRQLREKEGIDIMVVIFPTLDGSPPRHIASNFAKVWCDKTMHAVILHVPGEKDSPWIFPGGELVENTPQENLAAKVSAAARHARAEPTDSAKIRTATTETGDAMRYLLGSQVQQSRTKEVLRKVNLARAEKFYYMRKALLYGVPAALLALAVFCMLVFVALRRHRMNAAPRVFSRTLPPRRLGAPHTGGNNVVCLLGDKNPPPDPS